jgi:hypothetical protein
MYLRILTPLWFWEEPTYWPDTFSSDTRNWLYQPIFVVRSR